MLLVVADEAVELAESEDFRSFKIVVHGTTADLPHVRKCLAGIAELPDSATAWVSAEALRTWPTVKDLPAWQRDLTAMIEKARPHGWIDPQSGAIKAHVEWRQAEPRQYENDIDLLRDGFRQAMRRLASTVTIVTTNDGGQPYGMTATAVTSLALDPPSLMICVNKSASAHDPILRSRSFCVNLLRSVHHSLSSDFSGRKAGRERFETGHWSIPATQPPYLTDAQSSIFCNVHSSLPNGTHTIVIGHVTKVLVADRIMPLLHQDGTFGRFEPLSI
ncbi:MAG: flavin reductase family protein [Bradyrhizobium sp.]